MQPNGPVLVLDTQPFTDLCGELARRINNSKVFMGGLAALGQTSMLTSFVINPPGRPPWKNWSKVTQQIKDYQATKGHSPGRVLWDTGYMAGSVGQASGDMKPGTPPSGAGYLVIDNAVMKLTSTCAYGPKHNFGDPGGEMVWITIPAHKVKAHRRVSRKTGKTTQVKESYVNARSTRTISHKIPQREWFGWQPEDGDKALAMFDDYLIRGLAKK